MEDENGEGDPFMVANVQDSPSGRLNQIQKGLQVFRVAISRGRFAALQVPDSMTEQEWQQMLKGIDVNKVGVVDEGGYTNEDGRQEEA